MKGKKFLNWLGILLSVIGAVNWGLFGILEKDLITGILGLGWDLSRVIYIIVGLGGLWTLFFVLPKTNK